MSEPTSFFAGDTVTWDKSLSDYKASEGWTLQYRFRGPAGTALGSPISASADGDDFTVTVAASVTTTWPAGNYCLFGFVTKASERHNVFEGQVEVRPNHLDQGGSYDGRTHAKKVLDAIEAMLEGTASREEQSYSINVGGKDRMLQFFPREELVKFRNFYKREVESELAAERISNGMGSGKKIRVRFTRAS